MLSAAAPSHEAPSRVLRRPGLHCTGRRAAQWHGEESGTATVPLSSVDDAPSVDLDGLSDPGGAPTAKAAFRREDSESLDFDDGGEGSRRVGVWPPAAPPPPFSDRGSVVDGGAAGLDGSTVSGGDTGAIRAELQRLRAGFEARLTAGGPGAQAQRQQQGQMHEKVQL